MSISTQQQPADADLGPFVRPVRHDDLDALLEMASMTGGGMTNLPPDREALRQKIAWSEESLGKEVTEPDDEFYFLVLEDGQGRVIGTASIFSRLGAKWPFYSYKLSRVTHVSAELNRSFSTHLLHLVNDFDGASEVGGLFLHPDARAGGLGGLLARSRYLFMAQHRNRFGSIVIGDLRGWMEGDTSPFWEAVAGPFFGSGFWEADLHNALHGNQFIADLMPRYPIYISMLPAAARLAIGKPHESSVAALRMLEAEGFVHDGYCDIFDGGPTVHANIEAIRTIREAEVVCGETPSLLLKGRDPLVASGIGTGFRVFRAKAEAG